MSMLVQGDLTNSVGTPLDDAAAQGKPGTTNAQLVELNKAFKGVVDTQSGANGISDMIELLFEILVELKTLNENLLGGK